MIDIQTDEGTVIESITKINRVRLFKIELAHGQPGIVKFHKERLGFVNDVLARGYDVSDITRNVELVKAETVLHGGENVSFQTVITLIKKFHDKWNVEDGS